MIKNIIIFVLLLALGGMYWLSLPEENAGNPSTVDLLRKQAVATAEKIRQVLPAEPESEGDGQATRYSKPANKVSFTPQHPEQNQQVQDRQGEILETGIVDSKSNDAVKEDASKESSDEILKNSEISSHPSSMGTSKEQLSRSELSEILALLRQAKKTLRKKLFSVQPATAIQTESSMSDGSSPIKKKSADGP